MKYRVKVFDNNCCACRGGGSDSIYTQSVEAKDDNELFAICALSKFLDVNYSNRKAWLKDLPSLLEEVEKEKEDLEEDELEEFNERVSNILNNPKEAFEEINMDGADGGWECIYSIQLWNKKEKLYEEDDLVAEMEGNDGWW